MKLLNEIIKNFKLLFRNISSLSLIILGPLALILLIGFAFSGDSLHDIQIGVTAEDYAGLEPFLDNMSGYADIIKYDSAAECIAYLTLSQNNLCLEFDGDFSPDDGSIPTGEVIFYHDNSKKKVSSLLISQIKEYFGLAAEQISLESAQTVLDNVESLVVFIVYRKDEVKVIRNESTAIRVDLEDRKQKLIEVRDAFLPKYLRIKFLHSRIDSKIVELNSSLNNLYDERYSFQELSKLFKIRIVSVDAYITAAFKTEQNLDQLNRTLSDMEKRLHAVSDIANRTEAEVDYATNLVGNLSDYADILGQNETLITITSTLDDLSRLNNRTQQALSTLELFLSDALSVVYRSKNEFIVDANETVQQKLNVTEFYESLFLFNQTVGRVNDELDSVIQYANDTYEDTIKIKSSYDSMILELDNIKILLDDEIIRTQLYIDKIDAANERIDATITVLDDKMAGLSKIDPELAQKLAKPIAQSFNSLLKELKNIQNVFPVLLTTVIIFISLLFANIVSLLEINNKAYHRNLIAPVNDLVYVLGLIFTNFIVISFQVSVLLVVSQTRFGIDVLSNIWPVIYVSVLLIFIFIFLGMILAYIFKNEQTSILTTTFMALAFFLFSDVVTPLEAMPKVASVFAALNPMVIAEEIIRRVVLFNLPVFVLADKFLMLGIYFLVLLLVLLVVAKIKNARRV